MFARTLKYIKDAQILPRISDTERQALEAWVDGDEETAPLLSRPVNRAMLRVGWTPSDSRRSCGWGGGRGWLGALGLGLVACVSCAHACTPTTALTIAFVV